MPYNHKEEKSKKYPINIGGRQLMLSEGKIGELIKERLRRDVAVVKMFKEFELSLDQLNDLNIEIKSLDGRFAETDANYLSLSTSLFKDSSEDWFEQNYVIISHEIFHFICRRHEEKFGFFGDHEESESFVLSVASLLSQNIHDFDYIYNQIFPKISFHFHDPCRAKEFFMMLVTKAKKFLIS